MAEVVAQLEKQLESERKELAYARLKIQVLEEQLRQQRIAQYGPGSEKLSSLQLELLDEEPAVSGAATTPCSSHFLQARFSRLVSSTKYSAGLTSRTSLVS